MLTSCLAKIVRDYAKDYATDYAKSQLCTRLSGLSGCGNSQSGPTATTRSASGARATTTVAKLVNVATASTQCGAGSQCICNPLDVACNYCALAISQIQYCRDYLASQNLDESYLSDCLCYEVYPDPTYTYIGLWSPNYYDYAVGACPQFALTADPTDYALYTSATGYCRGRGNYYTAQLIDTATYELAAVTQAATTSVPATTRSGAASSVANTAIAAATSRTTGTDTASPASQSTSIPATANTVSYSSAASRVQLVRTFRSLLISWTVVS